MCFSFPHFSQLAPLLAHPYSKNKYHSIKQKLQEMALFLEYSNDAKLVNGVGNPLETKMKIICEE